MYIVENQLMLLLQQSSSTTHLHILSTILSFIPAQSAQPVNWQYYIEINVVQYKVINDKNKSGKWNECME